MTNGADRSGGSPAHDRRREGTVAPPEHNLKRMGGTSSPRAARLEDPELPHRPPSGRELRRRDEREEAREVEAAPEGD